MPVSGPWTRPTLLRLAVGNQPSLDRFSTPPADASLSISPRPKEVIMSTRRHRLTSSVAGALAVTALAAPSAGALPAEQVQGNPSGPAPASPRYPVMESKAGAPAPTVTRTIDDG